MSAFWPQGCASWFHHNYPSSQTSQLHITGRRKGGKKGCIREVKLSKHAFSPTHWTERTRSQAHHWINQWQKEIAVPNIGLDSHLDTGPSGLLNKTQLLRAGRTWWLDWPSVLSSTPLQTPRLQSCCYPIQPSCTFCWVSQVPSSSLSTEAGAPGLRELDSKSDFTPALLCDSGKAI